MSEDSSIQKPQVLGFRNLRESQAVPGTPESAAELKRLGRYQIVAELGRGAMGMVYEAHDPRIKRVVAIKIVTVSGAAPGETEAYRSRFIREAQAAGRLTHPGIVTVYDVDEDPASRTPFIVMEYVPGKRLDTHVAELPSQRLPLETALDLAQQIAEALDYAHSQGIVHRDIKPGNVIVTREGFAKIADFGIAKINLTEMTLPGQILGTPAFMSPEQFLEGTADGRSDLFSLGVMLYWMLTGVKPFPGKDANSVSFNLVYKDPTPLKDVAPELDPQFEAMLLRALAKKPDERFQSGKEFAQALKALRHGASSQQTKSVDRMAELQLAVQKFAQAAAPKLKAVAQRSQAEAKALLAKLQALQLQEHLKRLNLKGMNLDRLNFKQLNHLNRQWRIGLAAGLALAALFGAYRVVGSRSAPVVATAPAPVAILQPVAELAVPVAPAAPSKVKGKRSGAPAPSANRNSAHNQKATPTLKTAESASMAPPKLVPASTPEAPKAPEPLPAAPPASVIETGKKPAAPATLVTTGDHQFRSAMLSILVDGKLAFTGPLKGARKIPFGGVKGSLAETVNLPPGNHVVEVHIVAERDEFDETQSIKGDFESDKTKTLAIGFAGHNADMQLAWK